MDSNSEKKSEQFNISAEKHLQNRISAYKLKQNEIEQIWGAVKKRDEEITAKKEEHEKFRAANVQKEEIKLIKEYQAELALKPKVQINNFQNFKITANHNVYMKELAERKHIKNEASKEIENILSNAREQGRGPDNSQGRNNQQENQQTRG